MKKKILLIILAVIVLAAAIFGIYRLATYRSANHADRISGSTLVSYNRTVSGKAIATGNIHTQEILLLHTLTKTPGQDPVAVFYIYQLPEGANGEDYMKLQADEVPEDAGLIYMGTLSCRLVENNINSVYDMKAVYVR